MTAPITVLRKGWRRRRLSFWRAVLIGNTTPCATIVIPAENAAEYNDRHNAAKSKVETVEKHVEAAKQAETQATTFDDRRQAKEIRESVEREFKKAQEDLYNVPKLPKGDPLAPPRVNEVPDILLVARLMGTTGKAQELSEEATKMLNDAGPRTFDPDLIGAVIEVPRVRT
jgi:hypothetical protein